MTKDMRVPEGKEFKMHFDLKLKQAINFLEQCRPKTISMGNMIKRVREEWQKFERDVNEEEGKKVENIIYIKKKQIKKWDIKFINKYLKVY